VRKNKNCKSYNYDNGTTRLHAMMDIYGLFWGSTGA
jgi:hypothetical protein